VSDIGRALTVTVTASNTNGSVTSASLTIGPRPVTIAATTADKHYDGTDVALVASAEMSGVLAADLSTITLLRGTASFSDIGSADADAAGLTVTFAGFGIDGARADRYALAGQPASQTASIFKGFDAAEGTHYALTPANGGWANAAFAVTAKNGYLVSAGAAAEGDWQARLPWPTRSAPWGRPRSM